MLNEIKSSFDEKSLKSLANYEDNLKKNSNWSGFSKCVRWY